ncbi:MAG: hypothetical protein LBK95_01900 [Bifidobacteriaceae bacterium]|jgi:hypothetical protein|nr:hypothetical protein [Bifidobacteriaceae bacterium]
MNRDDEPVLWLETANGGEGPTPAATVERAEVDALVAAVASRDAAQQVVDPSVARARKMGTSWAVIGNALGVSRQAAHERYARVT